MIEAYRSVRPVLVTRWRVVIRLKHEFLEYKVQVLYVYRSMEDADIRISIIDPSVRKQS